MSEIAARNIPQKTNDVNNLWKWPTEFAPYETAVPTSHVSPVFWKWKSQVASNGYLDFCGDEKPLGTFTNDSVTTVTNKSGYSLGCFIDLQSGTYIFSCDSSPLESVVYFIEYQLMSDGKYVYSEVQKSIRFNEHTETTFEVAPDSVIMIKFALTATDGSSTTFTNIAIK